MFYEQLLYLCNKNGIKPTPLLKELGFSASNLKRWEQGATFNSEILLAVAKYFKVSTDYLLTGEENTKSDYENNNISINGSSNICGNNNSTLVTTLCEDDDVREFKEIIHNLNSRERHKLMSIVYDFEENCKKEAK